MLKRQGTTGNVGERKKTPGNNVNIFLVLPVPVVFLVHTCNTGTL